MSFYDEFPNLKAKEMQLEIELEILKLDKERADYERKSDGN